MKKHVLSLLLAVLLLCACTACTVSSEVEASASDGDTTAKSFRFSATDLDGNAVDASLMDGYDLVLLNFWAHWCGPCLAEMPDLETLSQSYPNLLLIGIVVDTTDLDATRAAVEQNGVTYPILIPKGDLADLARKCQYIPTTFFLTPEGVLSDPIVGSRDLAAWRAAVEELLP